MKASSSVKVAEYLHRVTRGEGFMPWQKPEVSSPEERRFRATMERRKDTILSHQSRTGHPVLLSPESLATARPNISACRPYNTGGNNR
ncbi:MAG: hypothetical protein A2498_01620 [Lentisphaerae bacterium RIFOXYC12_FULL_60_16]|nr:MAG: hypothetical protein A2498_01620 [Lentisphaerae bacterium RIFOXYC12_FULL_60_16]OGV85148.1 MAG: hypothetical protein A2340_01115 [Lentisphaerae bacterium RIFOXYB12_FULL_60_10]